MGERPRVAIVGAGFGGLAAARALSRAPVEVLMIDRFNFHTFQPLLYQVATAALEAEEIAHAIRGIFHRQENLSFRLGEVVGVDREGRRVVLARGEPIAYDFLILAAGAVTNDFGVPGVEEHAFGLKTLDEALRLRSHLIRQFERADAAPERIGTGALNVVVVGGGPTGIETAGAIMELREMVLRKDFPRLDVSRGRVLLVEARGRLLGGFDGGLGSYAERVLGERGIEILLGRTVEGVTPDGALFDHGEAIPTPTVIWAAGVKADPLAGALGVDLTSGGRIAVGVDLRISGWPEAFAIGDIAGSRDEKGDLHPQLAPVAVQAGRYAARSIERRLAGKDPLPPFAYKDRGTMATIGRDAAVAQFPSGFTLRGFLAWLAWAFLHLYMLIGFRNRLNVYVNWVWNYFTYDRSARLITMPERGEGRPREPDGP